MSDKSISCDFRSHMIADMTTRTFRATISDISGPLPASRSHCDTTTGDDIRRFPFAEVEQRTQPPRVNGQTSALRLAVCIDAKAPAALSLLPAPMSGSKWKPMCDHRDAVGHAKR